MKQILVLLVSVLLMSTWVPVSLCAKKSVSVARKEDIPYIKCQVCEKLASQLYHQVQTKQAQISPKKVFLSSGFAFLFSKFSFFEFCFSWLFLFIYLFGLVGC